MKHKIGVAVCVLALGVSVFAETYVPVEFIQTDGYAYLDTGIPGNAKKIQQKARLQYLAVPSSTSYRGVFGSYGDPANVVCYRSCAFVVASNKQEPAYAGSDSNGYYYGTPVKNSWHEYYLHHGYSEDYGSITAQSGVTKVGYNWNSLKNEDFSTLLVGNVNKPDSTPYTEQTVPMRWYYYEAIDHETGASLIKLTPAKCVETGAFGMIDAVNGGFYTSAVDGHPFLGPKYVAWTGSATTYDSNAIIRVPANTTNVVSSADVATISDLGGILVEDKTSVFSFSNFTASVSLYAPFYGPGEVHHELGGASRSLKIYVDNSAFGGLFKIDRAYVDLWHKYGLGLTNRVYYGTNGEGSKHIDLHTSGETAVALRFGGTGDSSRFVQSQSAPMKFSGPVELALTTSLALNAGNGSIWFTGPLTNVLTTGRIINPSKPVFFEGDYDRYFGKCYMRSGGQLSLGGRMHFASRGYGAGNNPQDYGNVGASSGNSVYFLNENVLDEDVIFLMGWSHTSNPTPSGTVDLAGYNQRVGRLITGMGGTVSSATRPQATSLLLKSETPATLRIRNTAVYGHGHFITDLPGCWPGRVNGAASVEIDTLPTIASPGKVSFTCAGSDTTGGLYARRGTIKVYETASFTNLTELVASGEGQLDIGTSAIGGNGLCVALTNSTLASGKVPLTIATDCVITAKTAIVTRDGKNKWLTAGDYTAAELPTLVGGAGTLKVREFGGKKGIVIFFR